MATRVFMSNSYAVDEVFRHVLPADRTFTMEENIQYALGDALMAAGKRLQRDATNHKGATFADTIKIEVRLKGWDLQVRLHMEEVERKEEEDVVS